MEEIESCRRAVDRVVAEDLVTLRRFGSAVANAAVLARACFVAKRPDAASALEAILQPQRGEIVLRGLITAHGPVTWFLGLLALLRGGVLRAHRLLDEARDQSMRMRVASWTAAIERDVRTIA